MRRSAYLVVVAVSSALATAAIVVAARSDDYDLVASLLLGAALCAVLGALGERGRGR